MRKRAHYVGCSIERTIRGKLALRFRWMGPDGKRRRFCVTMALEDTTDNRYLLEKKRRAIGRELSEGTFDPLRHFKGIRWPFGMGPVTPVPGAALVDRMETWIRNRDRPTVRRSLIRDYRSHLRNYFRRHAIGTLDPMNLALSDYEAFQRWLVTAKGAGGAGLTEKSAANVIRGTLRAFLRDAKANLATLDELRWGRYVPTRRQHPFDAAERDAILGWFRPRWFPEYVSLRLRFRGVTPSEARGLTVGHFDRRQSILWVTQSRHLGHVAATKTHERDRVVSLDEETVAALAELCEGRKPKEFPLNVPEDTLRDHFARALETLGIPQRSLYQCKHTCAIVRIFAGDNPGEIARDMGISLATFDQHYAWALRKMERQIGRTASNRVPENP